MTEKKLIIDQLKLSYEGFVDLAELYRLIDSWFYEKGWDKYEKMNSELVTPGGKQVRIIIEPWKNITDYFRIIIRIRINGYDLKEVEVEQDGRKMRLLDGTLKIVFDGYVMSDRRGKWNASPFLWFFHLLFDKYLFKNHYEKAERWLVSDVEDLHQKVKGFLNVYKYRGLEQ